MSDDGRVSTVWCDGVCVRGRATPGREVVPESKVIRVDPAREPETAVPAPGSIDAMCAAFEATRDLLDRTLAMKRAGIAGHGKGDRSYQKIVSSASARHRDAATAFRKALERCPGRRFRGWVIGYGGRVMESARFKAGNGWHAKGGGA